MNAIPCFQRILDQIIQDNDCAATFAYLDNITVCGNDQAEHDKNLQRFLHVAKEHKLTFNESKCIYSSNAINLLGYRIHDGSMQPEPNCVKTLYELPNPDTLKEQQRVVVFFFAYYAQCIARYSDKIKLLAINKIFPLSGDASKAFNMLKSELASVSLDVLNENLPFVEETDASDVAISATLNQNGRPVAFFSRSLNRNELRQSSIEKEA